MYEARIVCAVYRPHDVPVVVGDDTKTERRIELDERLQLGTSYSPMESNAIVMEDACRVIHDVGNKKCHIEFRKDRGCELAFMAVRTHDADNDNEEYRYYYRFFNKNGNDCLLFPTEKEEP